MRAVRSGASIFPPRRLQSRPLPRIRVGPFCAGCLDEAYPGPYFLEIQIIDARARPSAVRSCTHTTSHVSTSASLRVKREHLQVSPMWNPFHPSEMRPLWSSVRRARIPTRSTEARPPRLARSPRPKALRRCPWPGASLLPSNFARGFSAPPTWVPRVDPREKSDLSPAAGRCHISGPSPRYDMTALPVCSRLAHP